MQAVTPVGLDIAKSPFQVHGTDADGVVVLRQQLRRSCYIAGAADWGIYQSPGAFERMQREVCTDMIGVHLLPGAGHWVQQEQPEQVEPASAGVPGVASPHGPGFRVTGTETAVQEQRSAMDIRPRL